MWRADMEVPDSLKFQRVQFDRRYSRSPGESHTLSARTIRALCGHGEISALIDSIMERARCAILERKV